MVAILQRGLFWRVYLTLLGSLLLVAVLSALTWHSLAERPMPEAIDYPGAVLSALMPPANAPPAQTDQAMAKLSASVNGRVLLIAPDGRPLAAAS